MPYIAYLVLWFTVAIPALTGIFYYKRLKRPLRIIAILMVLGLLTEGFLVLLARAGNSNFYIVSIYTSFEIILLTLFFSEIVTLGKAKNIIKISGLIVLMLAIAEAVFGGLSGWSSLASSLESIFIIVAGLYYFYEVAMAVNPDTPFKSPDFWLSAIVLFYFMSSLEYFLLNRYLMDASRRDLIMLGNIHAFINAFCNLAYAVVLWKFTRSYSLER